MSVVTTTIVSDGKVMDSSFQLLSLDISKEVNRIPIAELVLIDGDSSKGDFQVSNDSFFEPGKKIEIKIRYEGEKDSTVFKGFVTRHGIEANSNESVINLQLKDAAIKLTHNRNSKVYRDLSDDGIISRIIKDAALELDSVEKTKPIHQELIQYNCTDWDFLLARADIQSLMVIVDDGKLSAKKVDFSIKPKHDYQYGISEIYNFEMEVDSTYQYHSVKSVAWDVEQQAQTEAKKAKKVNLAQGNLNGTKLAKAIGYKPYVLSHSAVVDPAELDAWANARLARSRMAMLRGRISVKGLAEIKLMDMLALSGTGARFEGKTPITGIRHRVTDNDWQTDIQFGLSPSWFAKSKDIEEVPAAGLLPAVNGLQIGVVDQFEKDPDGQLRVKVLIPFIDENEGAIWARLATPDAGNGRGYLFWPEQGDEVVVGFFNSDPRQAVILGSMFSSSKNLPAEVVADVTEDNLNKAIVTKAGTTLAFVDDEKASVYIETAQANKILLDDNGESISITDQHGNSIILSSDGIEISSAKDVIIKASGDVKIDGANIAIAGDAVDVK